MNMNFDQYTQNAQQAVADCQSIAVENGQQQLEGSICIWPCCASGRAWCPGC